MNKDDSKLLQILELIDSDPYLFQKLSTSELKTPTGLKIIEKALQKDVSVLLKIPNELHTLDLGKIALDVDERSFMFFKNGKDINLFLNNYQQHPLILSYIERTDFNSLMKQNKICSNVFLNCETINEQNYLKRLELVLYYFCDESVFLSTNDLLQIFNFSIFIYNSFKNKNAKLDLKLKNISSSIMSELKKRNFTTSHAIFLTITD